MPTSTRSARTVRAGSRLNRYLLSSLTVLASTAILFGMLPTELQYRMFPAYVGQEKFMESLYKDRYEWVGSENDVAAREADRLEAARQRNAVNYVSASR